MSQNALSRKVNRNGKVILDTHPESDQHQNWTCSRGSPPAPTHQIWGWSMNPFLRYLADKNSAHRQTDRQTDTRRWPQDLAAYGAQVIIIIKFIYRHKVVTQRRIKLRIATHSNCAFWHKSRDKWNVGRSPNFFIWSFSVKPNDLRLRLSKTLT